MTTVLGIETSCDETAAAVVDDGRDVRSSIVSSQVDLHARYGGVVPEIAGRAHEALITPVVAEALVEAGAADSDIDVVAATCGPGLVGSLPAVPLTRAMLDDGYDFSFSGIKTAVINWVRAHPEVTAADVAASFQACVTDVLTHKARRAAHEVGAAGICLAGGVAANSTLRERTLDICTEDGFNAYLPSRAMCTDNAAMIAATAWYRLASDGPSDLDGGADPNLRIDFLN